MRTTVISKETKEQIERHRRLWVQVAEQHDWYTEPFYIQVWLDHNPKSLADDRPEHDDKLLLLSCCTELSVVV